MTSTNPPFIPIGTTSVGKRYYPLANNSGSTLSFANAVFDLQATVSATPACPLVFPVNVRFKTKTDSCKFCERMIYLRMPHVTTYVLPDWTVLIKDGLLKGETDPLNITLNEYRDSLSPAPVGKQIEKWYADVKSGYGITSALLNHPDEVSAMMAIARRMTEQKGRLTENDVKRIGEGMQLVNNEIIPAPPGLIEEIMRRLNRSVGLEWRAVINNLKN
jgi:hypothetical protein